MSAGAGARAPVPPGEPERVTQPAYKRVLLKLSGEALSGDSGSGMDSAMLRCIAAEIAAVNTLGVAVALVIGGGNLVRGEALARSGMDRSTGDHMGMLATIMNALALQNALEQAGMDVRVMSALQVNDVCESYIRRRALRHLEKGRIVVFAAGTGNPFFTTDTAASLRASEINAELMLKATKVDGVYDRDPVAAPDAKLYRRLSYDQVLSRRLAVMDATAIVMCRDNNIPVRVFNLFDAGGFEKIVRGEDVGTLVTGDADEGGEGR